jgi:uridine kinase
MSRIVAVSAPVGGGKTTLTRGLTARLAPATAIHFDHYEDLTRRPLDEIVDWLRDGANVDAFELPLLVDHLDALRCGKSVVDPRSAETLEAADVVVFETPFGRRHAASGRFIDFSIWIDTPLDLALARKLQELTSDFLEAPDDELRSCMRWLHDYAGHYASGVHELLRMQREAVAPLADLIVDGSRGPESILASATRALEQQPGFARDPGGVAH